MALIDRFAFYCLLFERKNTLYIHIKSSHISDIRKTLRGEKIKQTEIAGQHRKRDCMYVCVGSG